MLIGIDASRANVKQKTGTEWYSWHLIRHLAPKLSGHRIRLYARESLEAGLQNLGPHVEARVLHWRLGFLWSHLRLSWEMLWHRPDVLFVPADTIPIVHPANTVTTIHDIAFERFPELYSQTSVQRQMGWLRPFVNAVVRLVTLGRYGATELDYHRWSVRHALRASRTIISVSDFTKAELVDALAANPRQIEVTHQGILQPEEATAEMTNDRKALLTRLGIHPPFFLYNGRLERKKNIVPLLRGFAEFRRAGGQAGLVLVGPHGIGWPEIKDWLNKHADVQPVLVLPWQPAGDLWALMRESSAYIFLSAYEGFGRPPLEAFSCGTVVIAANQTSLPEVLGSAARFVDPNNPPEIAKALQDVLAHPEQRSAWIARGQQQVRSFTWEEVAQKTATILTRK